MKKGRVSWWNRIRVRVLFFGIAMSIIPLLLLSFVSLNAVRFKLEENIQAQNLERAIAIAQQTDKFVQGIAETLNTMSAINSSSLIGGDDFERERILNTFLSQNSYIRGIKVVNRDLKVLKRIERMEVVFEEEQPSHIEGLTINSRNEYEVSPVFFSSDRRPQFIITVGVYDSMTREITGYLQATVDLKGIVTEFVSRPIGTNGYIYMVDQRGTLIGHTDFTRVFRHENLSSTGAVRKFITGKESWGNSEYSNPEGVQVIGIYSKAEKLGWGVFIEQPKQEAYQPIFYFVVRLLVILFLIIGAVTLISIFFGLKLTRPIENLEGEVRRIIDTEDLNSHIPRETVDEVGQLVGSFNQLMTMLEQRSQELKSEKKLLRTVVDGIGAGMVLLDSQQRIFWWNPLFAQWFGDNIANRSCQSVVAGEGVDCLLLENGKVVALEVKGERRYFRQIHYKLAPDNIERAAFLMILDDVTQQVEMEARVIETDKMAAIGLLSAGIAHEINNPLAIVYLHSEELLERLQEEPEKIDLKEIENSLTTISRQMIRCKQITSDLLHFVRRPSQTNALFDMALVSNKTLNLLEYRAQKHQIDIERFFSSQLMAWGNENEWQQVVLNLVTNALDASASGSKIQVRVFEAENQICFQVQDVGQGISPLNLKKVMDPFFTTKAPGQGTGLGLFISYGIVKKMQGCLNLESIEGQGTIVTITLPYRRDYKNASK